MLALSENYMRIDYEVFTPVMSRDNLGYFMLGLCNLSGGNLRDSVVLHVYLYTAPTFERGQRFFNILY